MEDTFMRIRVHALVTLLLFLSVAVVVCQRPVFATTISFASGAGVTPPTGGSIVDPNVEVSLDNGATWTPAYAADNTGLWPAPFPGSNWDTPSANREQGYGDPQYIQY